jgi:transcriptional regulator with XRE-family HTH domain
MSIGQRIKNMRKQQGMSIDELAYKLGKNRTTIYRYENGDIENLPLGILDCLADALNTTPAYLMGWADNHDNNTQDEELGLKMKHVEMWRKEFAGYTLTEEESQKLMEYAKFLISQRDK